MTDELEIQGLRDCIRSEQDEKNELNKKLQQLEKECKCFFAQNFPFVHTMTFLVNFACLNYLLLVDYKGFYKKKFCCFLQTPPGVLDQIWSIFVSLLVSCLLRNLCSKQLT